jgi:septal ring factor EnvC (AmiA/AmiB activator)
MPDWEQELAGLRAEMQAITGRLITLEVQIQNLAEKIKEQEISLHEHSNRQYERNQQIPTLLYGAIGVAVGIVTIAIQIWGMR